MLIAITFEICGMFWSGGGQHAQGNFTVSFLFGTYRVGVDKRKSIWSGVGEMCFLVA